MINFLEYRGPINFGYHKDYITMPNGAPGFVYTTEFRQRFLEKNFYFCRIDSIYQQNPTPPQGASIAQQAVGSHLPLSPKPTLKRVAAPLRRELPLPYDIPSFTYGGKPQGVHGRY